MIMNDWERDTFQKLAHMLAKDGFNFDDGYVSDLLLDVGQIAKMRIDDTAFILVRPMGTSWCLDGNAVKHLNTPELIGRAIGLYHIRKEDWDKVRIVKLDPRDYVGDWDYGECAE